MNNNTLYFQFLDYCAIPYVKKYVLKHTVKPA